LNRILKKYFKLFFPEQPSTIHDFKLFKTIKILALALIYMYNILLNTKMDSRADTGENRLISFIVLQCRFYRPKNNNLKTSQSPCCKQTGRIQYTCSYFYFCTALNVSERRSTVRHSECSNKSPRLFRS
jgi:hypothetical protein